MTLQHKIELIKNTFKRHTFGNTKDEILRSLDQFEDEVSPYCHGFFLCAVINWHKNIFLQKAGYFARAEEILDECLSLIENLQDSLSSHWKLKIYLSLGYVHRARWNYSDAQAYLNRALEISLAEEYLAKFRGEIYSLLSKVNLDLDRYTQAQKYVNLEKDEASRNYQSNPSNRDMGIIYAYSLINFSYINRHIGLVDREIQELLMQSVRIFTAIGYRKGVLKARLEFVIYEFMLDKSAKVLETAEALEMECRQLKMNKEIIRTGILLARVYKHQGDSLRAKIKLRELIDFSRERHFQHSKMTADAFYDLGLILYETNHEEEAFEAFTESTKIGMIIGLKDIIVRSSNAIGVINRNNPEKKLISDLLYQNTLFIKDRFQRNTNPLTTPGKSERFFATTMFVDIVGFSHLMLTSNEDSTVRMIDDLINRLCLVIYKNGGYIDKFLGDGFMAIFEHGSEMDATMAFKAVKSGTDIHRALKHKNRGIKTFYGIKDNIEVRIGISTGEIYAVFLGSYIKREFTYMGNSVNLASKLEKNAANRLMLIDATTFQLTHEKIHATKEQIHIHGFGESTGYHVRSLKRIHKRQIGLPSDASRHNQGRFIMNWENDDRNPAKSENECRSGQTAFHQIIENLSQFNLCENRQMTDDYCELVLFNQDMDEWLDCISDNLGTPIKSAGEKTTEELLEITHDFGEIVDHQTLFIKHFDDIAIMAMVWPWQDNIHTTLIVTTFDGN